MQRIRIDPERPNPRQLKQAIDLLDRGGLVAYPTDTVYGLGCDMMNRKAVQEIYKIKGKNKKSPLSFICADLKDISKFAIVSNQTYRTIKKLLPGPYTIILEASREVPRVMLNKRPTVGIRIPDHPVPRMLVEMLGRPIVTTSIPKPEDVDYNDPDEIEVRMAHVLDGLIDSGLLFPEPSTIVDLTERVPRLLRLGKGSIEELGAFEVVEDD